MSAMFEALYPDAAIPKGAWRWVESAQYRLPAREPTARCRPWIS